MFDEPSSEDRPRHPLGRKPEPPAEPDTPEPAAPTGGRKLHPLEQQALEMRARQQQQMNQPTPVAQQPTRPRIAIQMPQVQPFLTYALVAANILIFGLGMVSPPLGREYFEFGAKYTPYIVSDGEYYRLFTAMFLHADITHIFFNSYALYIIGGPLERRFGHVRFGIIYLLGGLMGSVLSLLLGDVLVPSIGASGAVFAVLGAEMVFLYRNRRIFGGSGRARLNHLFILLGINLFLGFASPRIDNWGHIGGFIGGAMLAWFLTPLFAPAQNPDQPGTLTFEDTNPVGANLGVVFIYLIALIVILMLTVPGLEREVAQLF